MSGSLCACELEHAESRLNSHRANGYRALPISTAHPPVVFFLDSNYFFFLFLCSQKFTFFTDEMRRSVVFLSAISFFLGFPFTPSVGRVLALSSGWRMPASLRGSVGSACISNYHCPLSLATPSAVRELTAAHREEMCIVQSSPIRSCFSFIATFTSHAPIPLLTCLFTRSWSLMLWFCFHHYKQKRGDIFFLNYPDSPVRGRVSSENDILKFLRTVPASLPRHPCSGL